jgi:subtilisin family serine protease
MTIFLTRYLLLFLVIGLSACSSTSELSRLGDNKSAEERRLLVTFVDRTINRDLSVNPQDSYRTRGQYGNSAWSKRIAVDLANRHHIQFIAQWPVTTLGVSCVVYEVTEVLPLQQVVSELQQDHDVASVQLMQQFKVLTDKPDQSRAYSDPYLKLQTGFQSLGIAELHKIATGRGVKIALIDTGVDTEHPDLKGQIEFSQDFAPEPASVGMADVHGTAVAGILSARPNNGVGIAGIAPDAEIMALRACWPNQPGSLTASCNSYTLALVWIVKSLISV